MLVAEVCEHSDDFVNGFHFKTRIESYLCDAAHKKFYSGSASNAIITK